MSVVCRTRSQSRSSRGILTWDRGGLDIQVGENHEQDGHDQNEEGFGGEHFLEKLRE